MKALFGYVTLFCLILTMTTACSNDEEVSEQDRIYFEENLKYIDDKKAEVDENGNLLYSQITTEGIDDVILYRILEKDSVSSEKAAATSTVTFDGKGYLINDRLFYEGENSFPVQQLIRGLALVILEVNKGDLVEAIIPAVYGYGYQNSNDNIRRGSTLIFQFTITKIE